MCNFIKAMKSNHSIKKTFTGHTVMCLTFTHYCKSKSVPLKLMEFLDYNKLY